MVKLFKLHKISGLSLGAVLFILGISGIFLDHDRWSFLYTITLDTSTKSMRDADKKLFDAYWIDPKDDMHRIVGGKRGIYETFDGGISFENISTLQCQAIRSDKEGVYAATSNGIYILKGSVWNLFALDGKYVNAISLSDKSIFTSVDKKELFLIERDNAKILDRSSVSIDPKELQEDIKLSRFVRDLHYGRGLLEGDMSLLINDYGAVLLSFLAISGYMIWYLISKKTAPKTSRKLIKFHSNIFSIVSLIPLIILAVTGIFLDHSNALARFMKSTTIPHAVLPPVYSTLKSDIWSLDHNGSIYRIGNRYGVYKSKDLKEWKLESRGFAFRMIRKKDILYVSGMGAPNRIYDGTWEILKNSPHMFRDVLSLNGSIVYFSTHKLVLNMPVFKDATLYSFMMSIHDGTFFAPWWIWINDIAAMALLFLGFSGTLRWYHRRKKYKKSTL